MEKLLGMYTRKAIVQVEFENKEDGMSYFNLKSDSKLSIDDYAKILAGGLALSIKASDNEVQLMTEIINYLQNEFVSNDAFKDLKKFTSD